MIPWDMTNSCIIFQASEAQLILTKQHDQSFTYRDWGIDDLQQLRSSIRNHYRNEQSGLCAYCQNELSLVAAGNAHVEHIVPKSLYQQFIFESRNLCVICADCNTIKREQETFNNIQDTLSNLGVRRYPRSSNAFKIVHPHFDDYDQHIIKKGKIYIDKSDKGGFTIRVCKLNRYYHQFNMDDDLVDDAQLYNIMNQYMNEHSSIRKVRILNDLKYILLSV